MPLDRLAIGAVAEDAQVPALAAGLGERVEQGDEILRRGQPGGAAEHEALAGRPAIGESGRRVDAVVDDVQLAARLDVAIVRELQVVVRDAHDRVAERRDGALGRRVHGSRGAAAARERPAVRGEHRLRAEPGEREPGEDAGLRRVDLHDVGCERARQRAQLAHGCGVVVGMRVAHEVAHVMERDVERGARIHDGPVGPVRCDLDRVALPQSCDERGHERLGAARLGERHDDEQPRGHAACCSTRRGRRPGGGASVAPASRARNSHSGSERSTIVRRIS